MLEQVTGSDIVCISSALLIDSTALSLPPGLGSVLVRGRGGLWQLRGEDGRPSSVQTVACGLA